MRSKRFNEAFLPLLRWISSGTVSFFCGCILFFSKSKSQLYHGLSEENSTLLQEITCDLKLGSEEDYYQCLWGDKRYIVLERPARGQKWLLGSE